MFYNEKLEQLSKRQSYLKKELSNLDYETIEFILQCKSTSCHIASQNGNIQHRTELFEEIKTLVDQLYADIGAFKKNITRCIKSENNWRNCRTTEEKKERIKYILKKVKTWDCLRIDFLLRTEFKDYISTFSIADMNTQPYDNMYMTKFLQKKLQGYDVDGLNLLISAKIDNS